MRENKTDAEKHREVQDRPSWRRRCSICVREYYDSVIGPCPERDGRQVCMYCCRMCEEHYTIPGQIGQRCRAKDRVREAAKRETKDGGAAAAEAPHQSPAATASPRGSQAAAAGTEDGKERSA